jgi:hypothetical protein
MLSLLIFFILSILLLFISYQALRYRRTYWMWPTISGFKNRKVAVDSKFHAYFIGFGSLIFGLVWLILFIKGVFKILAFE